MSSRAGLRGRVSVIITVVLGVGLSLLGYVVVRQYQGASAVARCLVTGRG